MTKRPVLHLLCLSAVLTLMGIIPVKGKTSSDNPYALIASRNVFGLHQLTFSQPPVEPAEPPVKISLTGITTVLGSLDALFKISNTSGTSAPSNKFYTLSEGETEDDVQVVQINVNQGLVTFNNHGVIQKIPLANSNVTTSH
jgi:hypothetical protein